MSFRATDRHFEQVIEEAIVRTTPALRSLLLATTDAKRLRRWYEDAFDVTANADGFLEFGDVFVLIDQRDDCRWHRRDRRNYASRGTGERGAWFYDSEGNLLALGQPVGGVDFDSTESAVAH